jgi:hypothetical protein
LIISHKHRFIFFAIPKTATHAIREALRKHTVAGDWEQQLLFGQQSLPIPDLASLGHGHISVTQLRPHLPSETWDSYFKFGFVRNPFDRFISTCFFLNRKNPQFNRNPVLFMKRALTVERFRERILVRPQAQLLTDENEEVAVDFVGRYENLQRSVDEIFERLNLRSTDLPKKNTSKHDAYTTYYDYELKEMVGKFYEEDLRVFDYGFESAPPINQS